MGASIATGESVVLAAEDWLPLRGPSTLTNTCHAVVLTALGGRVFNPSRARPRDACRGRREGAGIRAGVAGPACRRHFLSDSQPGNRGSRESRARKGRIYADP